jgi:hypothetical protein
VRRLGTAYVLFIITHSGSSNSQQLHTPDVPYEDVLEEALRTRVFSFFFFFPPLTAGL